MLQNYKTSFLVALALIFLLPLFFIPAGVLGLPVAKSVLVIFGIVVATLVFLSEIWREGKLNIPWHPFALIAVLMPLVYLLSALLSTPSSLSLFGYNFEAGTFGFVLLGSLLLVLVGLIFTDASKMLRVLATFSISISVVAVFVAIKVFFGGEFLVWGNFFGNMGNPIGDWTDLAVSFGLLSVLSILMLGMIPMKKSLRSLLFLKDGKTFLQHCAHFAANVGALLS